MPKKGFMWTTFAIGYNINNTLALSPGLMFEKKDEGLERSPKIAGMDSIVQLDAKTFSSPYNLYTLKTYIPTKFGKCVNPNSIILFIRIDQKRV